MVERPIGKLPTGMTPLKWLGPQIDGTVQWRKPQHELDQAVTQAYLDRRISTTFEMSAPMYIGQRIMDGLEMLNGSEE